jgi:peptidoglycan/xylan/chitin deacetylase (PgdA/CDA1 family)
VTGTCTLTFDDGPDPTWTPRVLAELGRARVRATFFVDTGRVARAPAVLRAMVAQGHDVELHCHRHVRHTERSLEELEHDTRTALSALARLGVVPTRWRTPWGVHTAATSSVAARHGLELVGWTVDTHDWRGDAAEAMLPEAVAELTSSSVVLMHDALGPGATRTGCSATVELIKPLVGAARQRGLRVVPLSAGSAGR